MCYNNRVLFRKKTEVTDIQNHIKAIIFDLDGTLCDTLSSIAHFANAALSHYGYGEIETQKYRYLVGNGADKLVHGMLSGLGVADETAFAKVIKLYNTSYDENFMYLTKAYDGITELIFALKAKGIKLCVLSNKPHSTTKKIIDTLFPNEFDLCYGKREGIPAKPNPQGVFEILDEISVLPQECLYVGDTSTDMQTGHNAGLVTIGVLWGFRDRAELMENNADFVVSKPMEIAVLL